MESRESHQLSASGQQADFTQTQWSLVLLAGQQSSPALEKLCRTYWYPIYAFVRRQGRSPHDAQDLTQQFFLHLLRKNTLAVADRSKGRFRTFLLAMLKNFLRDEWDKARAQKRGGDCPVFSLDELDPEGRYRHEPATDATPETLFHRKWAATVLEHAIKRLKKEVAASGKTRLFEALKPFITSDPEKGDYERLSAELAMKPNTIAGTVRRLRQRFGELVRAEVAETVANPAELEEELKSLLS